MAMATVDDTALVDAIPKRNTIWSGVKRFARRNILGTAGALIVIIMILMAVFADVITVYDPTLNDFGVMLEAPSAEHFLGTDQYGRDLLTRIMTRGTLGCWRLVS